MIWTNKPDAQRGLELVFLVLWSYASVEQHWETSPATSISFHSQMIQWRWDKRWKKSNQCEQLILQNTCAILNENHQQFTCRCERRRPLWRHRHRFPLWTALSCSPATWVASPVVSQCAPLDCADTCLFLSPQQTLAHPTPKHNQDALLLFQLKEQKTRALTPGATMLRSLTNKDRKHVWVKRI